MMITTTIRGELATGVGEATGFTQLDWARKAFIDRFGIDPFPGTVNLIVRNPGDRAAWRRVRSGEAMVISPPRTDWCDARCFAAQIDRIGGQPIEAAIILPDIASYAEEQIELIARVCIRDSLKVQDGDTITIHVRQGGEE
jgi:CTP-dependent riboflavin kinase